jgi:uncharacterized protein YbbC (DUF1343 family)
LLIADLSCKFRQVSAHATSSKRQTAGWQRCAVVLLISCVLLCPCPGVERSRRVKTGIDVLEETNFQVLQRSDGRSNRIGLVTNQTGVDSAGRRTIDVLAHAPGVELAAIFSPEHGITGKLDTVEIATSRDEATGVPIYSVYGATEAQRRPEPDMMKMLDAVVYDLQDVGVRFYTYETTLGYFLEAAAQAGIPIFILDRPNPANGMYVQGPISDPNLCVTAGCRFVNYHPLPVRHGMTIGELGKMFIAERHINAQLSVIAMQGWKRTAWFDATGLAWINPSPNLRSLTAVALYPGLGLLEHTNISVGRGTGAPFEVAGAPWIRARQLAAYLNRRVIPGVRFAPVNFTPETSVFAGKPCHGVRILVLDRNALDAPELGLELASALHKLYPGAYQLEKMLELLANRSAFDDIVAGRDPRRAAQSWRRESNRFRELRQRYLLY